MSRVKEQSKKQEELKSTFDATWRAYVEEDIKKLAPSGLRLRAELLKYATKLEEGELPLETLQREREELNEYSRVYYNYIADVVEAFDEIKVDGKEIVFIDDAIDAIKSILQRCANLERVRGEMLDEMKDVIKLIGRRHGTGCGCNVCLYIQAVVARHKREHSEESKGVTA